MSKWSVQSSECHSEFRVCVGCQCYQLLLKFRVVDERRQLYFVYSLSLRFTKKHFIWICVPIICTYRHNEPIRFMAFPKNYPLQKMPWHAGNEQRTENWMDRLHILIRYGDIFCNVRWIQSFVPLQNLVNESWFDFGPWIILCTMHYALCTVHSVWLLNCWIKCYMSLWVIGNIATNQRGSLHATYWYWFSLTLQSISHHIRCKRNDRKTLNCMLYWYVWLDNFSSTWHRFVHCDMPACVYMCVCVFYWFEASKLNQKFQKIQHKIVQDTTQWNWVNSKIKHKI